MQLEKELCSKSPVKQHNPRHYSTGSDTSGSEFDFYDLAGDDEPYITKAVYGLNNMKAKSSCKKKQVKFDANHGSPLETLAESPPEISPRPSHYFEDDHRHYITIEKLNGAKVVERAAKEELEEEDDSTDDLEPYDKDGEPNLKILVMNKRDPFNFLSFNGIIQFARSPPEEHPLFEAPGLTRNQLKWLYRRRHTEHLWFSMWPREQLDQKLREELFGHEKRQQAAKRRKKNKLMGGALKTVYPVPPGYTVLERAKDGREIEWIGPGGRNARGHTKVAYKEKIPSWSQEHPFHYDDQGYRIVYTGAIDSLTKYRRRIDFDEKSWARWWARQQIIETPQLDAKKKHAYQQTYLKSSNIIRERSSNSMNARFNTMDLAKHRTVPSRRQQDLQYVLGQQTIVNTRLCHASNQTQQRMPSIVEVPSNACAYDEETDENEINRILEETRVRRQPSFAVVNLSGQIASTSTPLHIGRASTIKAATFSKGTGREFLDHVFNLARTKPEAPKLPSVDSKLYITRLLSNSSANSAKMTSRSNRSLIGEEPTDPYYAHMHDSRVYNKNQLLYEAQIDHNNASYLPLNSVFMSNLVNEQTMSTATFYSHHRRNEASHY